MKTTTCFLLSLLLIACNPNSGQSVTPLMNPIHNETINDHAFLACIYADDYFPDHLVDKGVAILKDLCK
jgi:hypothetical protein